MAAKSDFLTSMGGATTVVGATKAFTAAVDDDITATGHGKDTGFGPVRLTTTTTLPSPLSLATDYWLIVIDVNTVQLSTSKALAIAGTAVDITNTGIGTHTMRANIQTLGDQLEQSLTEVLTFPGNRSAQPSINIAKFWDEAVQGTGF